MHRGHQVAALRPPCLQIPANREKSRKSDAEDVQRLPRGKVYASRGMLGTDMVPISHNTSTGLCLGRTGSISRRPSLSDDFETKYIVSARDMRRSAALPTCCSATCTVRVVADQLSRSGDNACSGPGIGMTGPETTCRTSVDHNCSLTNWDIRVAASRALGL